MGFQPRGPRLRRNQALVFRRLRLDLISGATPTETAAQSNSHSANVTEGIVRDSSPPRQISPMVIWPFSVIRPLNGTESRLPFDSLKRITPEFLLPPESFRIVKTVHVRLEFSRHMRTCLSVWSTIVHPPLPEPIEIFSRGAGGTKAEADLETSPVTALFLTSTRFD